ncbi:MAG TPA: YbaK/EbsC family protein [Anaerolineales bacterium]|jgi:prolyl-tRNA synthetase
MRFSDLSIQTQRAAPSEIRTEGLAFLYRAGYVSRSGEPVALGQRAIQRLRQASVGMEAGDFFTQLRLPVARAGESAEIFALLETAPEEILLCPACGYAARRELARSLRHPFSTEAPLPVEKILTPDCSSIAQLAAFLQIPQQKTAKALMFTRLLDGQFIFVVVRGDLQLSESKLKACVGEVRLATPNEIAASGAVAGYASPVGLHGALVVVDELIARSPNLVAGANQPGYHLKNTNYPRDYQAGLVADVTLATPGDLCPACGSPLEARNGLPVFSEGLLNFDALLLALAECHHDDKGLTLPSQAAPFDVYLMNVPGKTLDTARAAMELYSQLEGSGISVLLDDRDERAGVKFNDADLIGCPMRVTVGERGLQNGQVEVKARREAENTQIPLAGILSALHPS